MADTISIKLITRRLFICISSVFLSAPFGFAQDIRLSDQLINVNCTEHAWMRYATIAQARQLGFSKEELLRQWPGLKDYPLPPVVEKAIESPLQNIDEWLQCAFDARPTNITRLDVLGQPAPGGEPVTCGEAAIAVLSKLVPFGAQNLNEGPRESIEQQFRKAATSWAKEARSMGSEARMQLWHQRATAKQRRDFFLLTIQFPKPTAVKLVEQDFIQRAKDAPDALLELEVGAYCRHRRAAANEFFERYAQQRGDAVQNAGYYNQVNRVLTDSMALHERIERFLSSGEGMEDLHALLQFSIDRPWAFHSMKVESISMGIPILENQLQSLVSAAHRTDDCGKRIQLLDAADGVVETLREVMARSDLLDIKTSLRLADPQGKLLANQLRDFLPDNRPAISSYGHIHTPATSAAKLIWQLWGPNSRYMDMLYRDAKHDWRGLEIDLLGFSTNDVLIETAPKIIDQEIADPKPVNKGAVLKLADLLMGASAEQTRERFASLSWEDRLLVGRHAIENKQLKQRLQKCQRTWLGLDADAPESLQIIWADHIAKRELNLQAYEILIDWLANEARQDRYWCILAESQRVRLGLMPKVMRSDKLANIDVIYRGQLVGTRHIYVSAPSQYSNFRCMMRIGDQELSFLQPDLGNDTSRGLAEILKENVFGWRDFQDGLQIVLVALPGAG